MNRNNKKLETIIDAYISDLVITTLLLSTGYKRWRIYTRHTELSMPPPPSSLASAITLSVVGLWSKAFLALTTKSFEVQGRHHLIDALKGEFRGSVKGKEKELAVGDGLPRRGIVTGRLLGRSDCVVSWGKAGCGQC